MPRYRGELAKGHRERDKAPVTFRTTVEVGDPARYLAALAVAEMRAVVPPETPVVSAAPVPAPATQPPLPEPDVAPAAKPAPREEPPVATVPKVRREKTLTEVMAGICANCAATVDLAWSGMPFVQHAFRGDRTLCLSELDRAIARMVQFEHDHHRTKTHTRYFVDAYKTIMRPEAIQRVRENPTTPDAELIDASAIDLLIACEHVGIRFEDRREFAAFHAGLRARIIPTESRAYDFGWLPATLLTQLETHVPHLPAETLRRLNQAKQLLFALDLFGEDEGATPLCKSMRLAAAAHKRHMTHAETFQLRTAFGRERTDDLIALLENPSVRQRGVSRLGARPEVVSTHGLDDLTRLLAA